MRVNCNSVVWCPLRAFACTPIACSQLTTVQHGDSDPVLGSPHSERAFLPVKPSASARDSQEAEKRNQCVHLRDRAQACIDVLNAKI